MPIYEYWCLNCRRISSHLVLNTATFEPYCNHCGGRRVKKLISRVNVRLSEETRLERLTDPSLLGGLDENDPRSMMKLIEKMGPLAGDDLEEDFGQMMEEAMEEMEQGSKEDSTSEEAASLSEAVQTTEDKTTRGEV
ncbi:zinc ribbon domain-containing protein [Thermosulfuriphilus ammonigenes]|uniref:Zinc ribbon domain-containing protein n=1 Tax=Thermosulfuriphilus ammonigenes TaxID=1936021 RepID=A0A6G7PWY8_9BACT|nr:FmdB family zinc ribbon protein [Thermosulfuriphilus ammonigenes]MBA2847729.1 putative FmdB family regulatory protein [Thermosulfuriphilus ammonigenes]QIJ72066.1 zinc ribbon domain-containing protein [Thermosulfuriphilus ammonigenes]